jgi:hypothetical protein
MNDGETAEGRDLRRYDKGERRFKHVGRTDKPEFHYDPNRPRHWIGKCPRNLSSLDHSRLVNEAIASPSDDDDDDEPAFQKRLHVVERGAIYRLETTDRGHSYHGYPYRGRLGKRLVAALRGMAKRKECLPDFEVWVKEYIETSGS